MPGTDRTVPLTADRILVAGVSGSGKSTLCRRLSVILDLPYTEIDGLFHGPDWTPRPEFLDDVREVISGDRWITEWQYRTARPMLLERAQVLLWLDYPFWTTTFPRIVRRTLNRRWRRTEMWNGNYEQPLHRIFFDRDHIIRWAVRTRHKYRDQIASVQRDRADIQVIRFHRPQEVEHWLATM